MECFTQFQIVYPEHLSSGPEPETGCESVVIDRGDGRATNSTKTSAQSTAGNSATRTNCSQAFEGNGNDQFCDGKNIGVDSSGLASSLSAESGPRSGSTLHSDGCHVEIIDRRSSNNVSEVGCTSAAADDDVPITYSDDVPKKASNTLAVDNDIKHWLAQLHMSSLLQRCGGIDTDPGWVW